MYYSKILFLCIIIGLLQAVTAVTQCYHCSSTKAGSCGDGFNAATTASITCVNRYCNSRTLKDPNTDLIIRGCVEFTDICDDPAFYPCKTCAEDLCNYAVHSTPYFSIILISSILIYLCM